MASADEQQRQGARAIQWLESHWINSRTCPICSSQSWAIGSVSEWREFDDGNLNLGGPITPVFTVVCNVCGYTFAMNALVSGVVERTPPPGEATNGGQ